MKFFSPPLVLIHGGLGDHKKLGEMKIAFRSMSRISRLIQKNLHFSATDIALKGILALEADSLFNAGLGSRLQSDGCARLSASLMQGKKHRFVSVSNMQSFKHPSKLLVHLLEQRDRSLSGIEASQFALSKGLLPQSPISDQRFEEWRNKHAGLTGTVGCIVLDKNCQTAATTSTGGRGMETPGRFSDSGTPAGNFAIPEGAISCTGIGEDIIDAALASSVASRLEDGMSLQEAVTRSFFRHHQRTFALISLDNNGNALVHATKGKILFSVITKKNIAMGSTYDDWMKVPGEIM